MILLLYSGDEECEKVDEEKGRTRKKRLKLDDEGTPTEEINVEEEKTKKKRGRPRGSQKQNQRRNVSCRSIHIPPMIILCVSIVQF